MHGADFLEVQKEVLSLESVITCKDVKSLSESIKRFTQIAGINYPIIPVSISFSMFFSI